MQKRVVITGLGLVSCFGSDINKFYQNLLDGICAIDTIDLFNVDDFPTKIAAYIKDFDIEEYMQKKQARRVDPFIRYAMKAGKKALENANFSLDSLNLDPKRAGILVGSGMGGMKSFSDGVETLIDKGYKRLTPFFVPFIITNMAGALLAIDLNFQGPNYSISTACATSNYCIHQAAKHIRRGDADIMLTGGSEAPMSPIGLAGFVQAKALSTRNDSPKKASRPWDKNRDGFVMGEGAGVLVLEELEHAKKRNAPILAEYMGGALNTDAYHMTDPREDGSVVSRCILDAIKDAKLKKEDIDYINAHATSTMVGDLCEIKAFKNAFEDHLKNVYINATKSMIGHCLGAASAIEAIATIMAIKTGKLHPTINLEDPEDEIKDLKIVKDKAQDHKIKAAMSTSFGFGGHNSAVIFAPYNE